MGNVDTAISNVCYDFLHFLIILFIGSSVLFSSSHFRCRNHFHRFCYLFSVLGRIYSTLNISKRSEEHTSELQSRGHLVCRLLLEQKKIKADKWIVVMVGFTT